jgi:hypothetical protein
MHLAVCCVCNLLQMKRPRLLAHKLYTALFTTTLLLQQVQAAVKTTTAAGTQAIHCTVHHDSAAAAGAGCSENDHGCWRTSYTPCAGCTVHHYFAAAAGAGVWLVLCKRHDNVQHSLLPSPLHTVVCGVVLMHCAEPLTHTPAEVHCAEP